MSDDSTHRLALSEGRNGTRPIIVVAGARPNFMKVVPILRELDRRGVPRLFVHTGQHYDINMSAALLADLDAPTPDVLLEVGSASHAVQSARAMERFEPVVLQHRPAWIVVVGDVNSTLACALVAAKLRPEAGCRIAHVEAGLRSNDWAMPEEVNRVLTDRLSDLLFTPVPSAATNLAKEGLSSVRTEFVGNVMIDALHATLPKAGRLQTAERLGLSRGQYVLATLHRPANVDDQTRLSILLDGLAQVSRSLPVVFPVHPRTHARIDDRLRDALPASLVLTEPLGYAEMVSMLDGAAAVLTDSGGVQQETTVLGVPCVTLRQQTEWPDTVTHGTNRLSSWPVSASSILRDTDAAVARPRMPLGSCAPAGWDGRAAARIVSALVS
jgi:UDP-N-acetylglucosamine 2-epimerase (non-hydrolysing)